MFYQHYAPLDLIAPAWSRRAIFCVYNYAKKKFVLSVDGSSTKKKIQIYSYRVFTTVTKFRDKLHRPYND